MTNQEILEKAITKAIAGGWKEKPAALPMELFVGKMLDNLWVYNCIFNHDFAKALWGEVPNTGYLKAANLIPWKYHLQQMVIDDDPIAYLGDNLPVNK